MGRQLIRDQFFSLHQVAYIFPLFCLNYVSYQRESVKRVTVRAENMKLFIKITEEVGNMILQILKRISLVGNELT